MTNKNIILIIFSSILIFGCGSGSDTKETTPPQNTAPTSDAGVDQSVDENTVVNLTGSATDSDGSITSYSWSQTSGTSVSLTNNTSVTSSFTSPITTTQLTLSFELTVTDDDGAIGKNTISIFVNPVNALPTANAGPDQTVNEQTSVSLIGSGSDSDGSISSFSWLQTSGTSVSLNEVDTANTSFTSSDIFSEETLVFELTVTDNESGVAQDEVNILVQPSADTIFLSDLWLYGVNGVATFEQNNGIKLTSFGSTSQKGYAFSSYAIDINSNTSFATKFTFFMYVDGTNSNVLFAADGITFMLHNDPRELTASTTGGMGYTGIKNAMSVTFDSFSSEGTNNLLDDNVFLRIDDDELNPLVEAKTQDPFELITRSSEPRYVWIDYDGNTNNIQIFLSTLDAKPVDPIINSTVDLFSVVGERAFVGFAASTGAPSVHTATQQVYDWEFIYTN